MARLFTLGPLAMRTIILGVSVLALVCLGVGYERGQTAAVRVQDVYDLHVYPSLYRLVESGDTNRLRSSLQALIISRCYYYDTHFSSETVTNQAFIRDLTEARAMASQNREQLMSGIEQTDDNTLA